MAGSAGIMFSLQSLTLPERRVIASEISCKMNEPSPKHEELHGPARFQVPVHLRRGILWGGRQRSQIPVMKSPSPHRTARRRIFLVSAGSIPLTISPATLHRLARVMFALCRRVWNLVRLTLHTQLANSGASAEMVLKSLSGRASAKEIFVCIPKLPRSSLISVIQGWGIFFNYVADLGSTVKNQAFGHL